MAGVTSSAEGGDEGSRDRTDQVGLANMEVRSGDSGDCSCDDWGLDAPIFWCDDVSVGCCDRHRRHTHAVGAPEMGGWA